MATKRGRCSRKFRNRTSTETQLTLSSGINTMKDNHTTRSRYETQDKETDTTSQRGSCLRLLTKLLLSLVKLLTPRDTSLPQLSRTTTTTRNRSTRRNRRKPKSSGRRLPKRSADGRTGRRSIHRSRKRRF